MHSYLNKARVRRLANVGRVLGFGGLGVMAIGLILSFRQPYNINQVFAFFLVGMIASQIGMPLVNRWGRSPRIDEILDSGLRGLDSRYALFHYSLGADHALITPAGVFALIPRLEEGRIEYAQGQWRQTRERRGILRRGGTRQVRGLERQVQAESQSLSRKLGRLLEGAQVPPIEALLVFLHPRSEVMEKGAPLPVAHIKKLKAALRKLPKAPTLDEGQIARLVEATGLG